MVHTTRLIHAIQLYVMRFLDRTYLVTYRVEYGWPVEKGFAEAVLADSQMRALQDVLGFSDARSSSARSSEVSAEFSQVILVALLSRVV